MKKLLAVFAHPDEAFGPGGTLAKYAHEGVEIHLLSATRGEAGEDDRLKSKIPFDFAQGKQKSKLRRETKIHHLREKELLSSAKVLGITKVEFLDFADGRLCNANYHDLARKIREKITEFEPQVILTHDRLGISGHLDHIAVSLTTTYAYLKTKSAQKLYYLVLPAKWYDKKLADYFIYFPEGYNEDDITTKINYSKYWDIKKKAMLQHKTQMNDVRDLLVRYEKWPKVDNFILKYYRKVKVKFPESDLFAGIK